ncbi:syntaxin-10-like [Tachypleus tridentatus]|uniref:syntaxin-10-like n=1 Tax=Tachypleus tridentatus TaxID=6853 RepID=UPI003FD651DF
MSLEDPFFVVKDEVIKAVSKTKGLYQRWCELQEDPNIVSKEEVEWTTNELRNGLRSIEWDLEDLEETVAQVSSALDGCYIFLGNVQLFGKIIIQCKILYC